MAVAYSKERSKYGNLTGQIIIWPVQISPDINSASNKRDLPSGYLRCDGTAYNVVDYPQLAAICGSGPTGKFVRRDLNGDPIQTISDEQFVVPDLGSKYPKPTSGADAGSYRSVRVVTQAGLETNRAGIGIEATSTLGLSINLTYSGTFIVPSQTVELRGRPSWTIGTQSGRRTDSETVSEVAMHGHMHFFNGVRTRIKATNEVDASAPTTPLDPKPIGQVAFFNASTVPIDDWLDATMGDGTSNFPGNNQPPCRAMASNRYAVDYEFYFGAFDGVAAGGIFGDPTAYSNGCFNSGANLEDQWRYLCLITEKWNNYPISSNNYQLNNLEPYSDSGSIVLGLCVMDDMGNTINVNKSVNATYTLGTAPKDWRDVSLVDAVPLNTNNASGGESANFVYASLFNSFTESEELNQQNGDPTEHFHKLTLTKGEHNFALVTDPLELSPDALTTTLNLSVDQSASVDSVATPFIVLEYLIKI